MNQDVPLFDENGGFAQILEHSALKYPDKTALIFYERRISYGQLNNRAGRLAALLRARGMEEGKRVALLMPNCPEFLEIVFACAKAGIPVVKINWRLSPREIQKLLEFNDTGLLFFRMSRSDWKQELLSSLGDLPYFDLDEADYEEVMEGQTEPLPHQGYHKDHVLMHLHTSGTSGVPKCVMYTHGGMLRQVALCASSVNFRHDVVFQIMAQLFHTVSIGAYMCFCVGGTLVFFERFDPLAYLDSIQNNRVNRINTVPTVVQVLLDCPEFDRYDLSTVREMSYATSPMPPALLDRLMEKLPSCDFYQSYGMTEMGSTVTVLDHLDHRDTGSQRMYSVGRAMPGCGVRIVDDADNAIPPGEMGEVTLRGPGLMKGYYKMPEATSEAIRDGWYYTGDIGHLDEDGYLFLHGRKNDMIISGGENVYPREVEDALLEFKQDVSQCAVFGVPHPLWGEQVTACVVLQKGSAATEESLREGCADRLAKFKIPKRIYLVDSLPQNAVGKIMRKTLREQYSGAASHAESH